jgi:hypothetical protein
VTGAEDGDDLSEIRLFLLTGGLIHAPRLPGPQNTRAPVHQSFSRARARLGTLGGPPDWFFRSGHIRTPLQALACVCVRAPSRVRAQIYGQLFSYVRRKNQSGSPPDPSIPGQARINHRSSRANRDKTS